MFQLEYYYRRQTGAARWDAKVKDTEGHFNSSDLVAGDGAGFNTLVRRLTNCPARSGWPFIVHST